MRGGGWRAGVALVDRRWGWGGRRARGAWGVAERRSLGGGRLFSREPLEFGQSPVPDSDPDYADQRRPVHATLDWKARRDDTYGAHCVGENRDRRAPLECADRDERRERPPRLPWPPQRGRPPKEKAHRTGSDPP